MSNKPTSNLELIQPLQSFLETFTQELTEQKFVPAFRDELKRLLTAVENLQKSETSLQQIASGVERLREVFAPAGTKLLEGAKDLETAMRAGADQIKGRAADVLKDLLQTHEQLEASLRNEAGLLQEQTSASREAVSRAVAEIEGRLNGLTTQLEGLCQRLDKEIVATPSPTVEAYAPQAAPELVPTNVTVEFGDELRELLANTEQAVARELELHHADLVSALQKDKRDDSERLAKIDQQVAQALASVGPRIEEELESVVTRLRDQMQTLILAETEAKRTKASEGESASGSAVQAEMAASETRILREIGALQKSQKGETSQAERILRELAQSLEDAADRQIKQTTDDAQTVKEALTNMQRVLMQVKESAHKDSEQLSIATNSLDALAKGQREQRQVIETELRASQGKLDAQNRLLEQKMEEDRQALTQLAAAMQRAEQAATTATELALADSRSQREKIDGAIKDLRERLERGLTADAERSSDMLHTVAEAWTEALDTLRDFIQKTLTSRTDSLISRMESIESKLSEQNQSSGTVQRDLQSEIRRTGAMFDEKITELKTDNETFATAVESHVKAVSGEVAALRGKQDQQLAVLREAIHANYEENAARLKEVIESAYDTFIKQSGSLPQSMERFSHLLQSLHQGDQLALQSIVATSQNTLSLATEKFEQVLTETQAQKKYYPLLDKKLEKVSGELEAVRKAQVRQEKDLADQQKAVADFQENAETRDCDLRESLRDMQARTAEAVTNVRDELTELKADVDALAKEDLPALRKDMSSMITSKFDFIEHAQCDREEVLRTILMNRLEQDRAAQKKNFLLMAALVGASILLQLLLRLGSSGAHP